jgi:hypothetical protein
MRDTAIPFDILAGACSWVLGDKGRGERRRERVYIERKTEEERRGGDTT